MNFFQSLHDYEEFIYSLLQQYNAIESTTLVVYRRGAAYVIVTGDIHFPDGYRLAIQEHLSHDNGPLVLERYSYEVWQNDKQLYWYDPQPHPDNPDLASTHPHHKHVPPNIKRNRIPVPGLSFEHPNLPFLIEEIEQTLLQG